MIEETLQENPVEVATEENAPPVSVQRSDDPNLNFSQLREERNKLKKERDEAFALLKQVEAAKQKESTSQDSDFSIAPDDLVEGKHLSKYDREIKALRSQLESYKQQQNAIDAETRLKSQYADFDKVVNAETISALRDTYPDIAASLHATNDLYTKASSTYTLIKKLGLYQEDIYQKQRGVAEANAAKPRPLSSVNPQQGDSPLSKANAFAEGLTPELRAQLLKEMQSYRKLY